MCTLEAGNCYGSEITWALQHGEEWSTYLHPLDFLCRKDRASDAAPWAIVGSFVQP